MVLLAAGSLGIGLLTSQVTTCDYIAGALGPDCRTETDFLTLVSVAAGAFVGGVILYYPLYFHLSILSEAVADLLAETDSDDYP